jgi:hypothetical protein
VKLNRSTQKDPVMKRSKRQTIAFNAREMKAIDSYCSKYKVGNRSKFMREAIIKEILKKYDQDYPTLFDINHPSLFSQTSNNRRFAVNS